MGKYDLSILIPGRNEMFMGLTVQDILDNTSDRTEVICIIDGEGNIEDIPQHERVTVIYLQKSIGQRAATNMAARLSKAKYLCKTDAHCAFDKGFDEILMNDMQDDWTVVPAMRNLHAFDWVCEKGHRRYQGPSGPCLECNAPTKMDVLWFPKSSPRSRSYCFDSEPHFQYFNDYTKRSEFKEAGDLTYSMSLQGSFFMCTRKKYWELDISSESQFGSWGSQGIEAACKTWLTGGKVVCNNKTWYAHLFRTQGGDFSFPYQQDHSKALKNRAVAKDVFFKSQWKKQIYPLSMLLEKFWPINCSGRGWSEGEYVNQKIRELKTKRAGVVSIENRVNGKYYIVGCDSIHDKCIVEESLLKENKHPNRELQEDWNTHNSGDFWWHVERFCRRDQVPHYEAQYKQKAADGKLCHPKINWDAPKTKGILYYTDGELDENIAKPVRDNLKKAGLPITAVSLKPIDFGDKNIHLPLERGPLAMAKQILAGLEAMAEDVVYFAEHDCLYSPHCFTFIPPSKDVYYYNLNCWKLHTEKGYALKVDDCRQLSGLCAYRETLINHYKERVRRLEQGDPVRAMGFEPGTHNRQERVDDLKSDTWVSAEPMIDIRHSANLTKNRWRKEEFRNQKYTEGWTESRLIPFWGDTEKLSNLLTKHNELQPTT